MICDSHNDLLTGGAGAAEDYLLSKDVQEHVRAVTLAMFFSDNAVPSLDWISTRARRYGGALVGRVRTVAAIENAGFVTEQGIEQLTALPLQYIGLTWNNDNALAGGANGSGRLTAAGKRLVRACRSKSIPIDTAHLNERSFFDVADMGGAVLNSHCCIKGICNHPRNLNDEQIRTIADSGGYIGITLVGSFLRDKGAATADDVARHIDYVVQRFGIDCVGVGSDFFGTENLPVDIKNYQTLGILVARLRDLGYNEDAISSVMHGNYLRFFAQYT